MNSNASGVAVLLEIARAWSAAVREGATPPPAREVRFAVWGSQAHSPRAWLSSHLRRADAPLLGVLDLRRLALSDAGHRLHIEPDDHSPNDELIRHATRRLSAARGRAGIPERWVTNRGRGSSGLSAFIHAPALKGAGVPAISLFAAGSWKSEEVKRTLGKPGESWSERDLITIPHDPLIMSKGDEGPDRVKDRGALMEAASRAVLIILPSWLEGLPD
jgi:hypothetical protein